MRVESRIPGADMNSHHAFAATIAGGLYGIAQPASSRRRPTTATATPPTTCPASRHTMAEAIDLWRDSTIARECFGDDVHHHVLNFAEQEWLAFQRTVTDWELRRYFERI